MKGIGRDVEGLTVKVFSAKNTSIIYAFSCETIIFIIALSCGNYHKHFV